MKISRRQFVKAMAAMSAASVLGSSGGKKALTFQIWDVAQKEGMEAMCAAYTQQHPEVSIEVQVTSWNEYWTKLEAAATGNQMPDIFWMHTNELLKYADNGMLADCSDIVEKDKFSEISLSNAMGSNGTLYAVPKDKDTVGLVYNKEMFDVLLTRTRTGPGTIWSVHPRRSTLPPASTAIWHTPTTSLATGTLCIRPAAIS